MKNSSKVPIVNPLQDILEAVPYTEAVLDPELIDKLNLILLKQGEYTPCASVTVALLVFLSEHNLIEMQKLTWPNTLGCMYIIKRIS